jgi:hypothetical protein
MMVFPKTLLLKDVPKLQQQLVKCLEKSVHNSLWVADECVYREHTMQKKRRITYSEGLSDPMLS